MDGKVTTSIFYTPNTNQQVNLFRTTVYVHYSDMYIRNTVDSTI